MLSPIEQWEVQSYRAPHSILPPTLPYSKHPLGAVPSTLHQMIKVPVKGKVEIIRASTLPKDVSSTTVEWHPALQGFQVAVLTVEQDLQDALPVVNPAIVGMFEKMGFEPGKGLGKAGQGVRRFNAPVTQTDSTGLGYGRRDRSIAHPGIRERLPGMNGWFVKEGRDSPHYEFSCEFHFREKQVFPGFGMLVATLEEVLEHVKLP